MSLFYLNARNYLRMHFQEKAKRQKQINNAWILNVGGPKLLLKFGGAKHIMSAVKKIVLQVLCWMRKECIVACPQED